MISFLHMFWENIISMPLASDLMLNRFLCGPENPFESFTHIPDLKHLFNFTDLFEEFSEYVAHFHNFFPKFRCSLLVAFVGGEDCKLKPTFVQTEEA